VEKDKNTVGSVAAKVLATSEAIFMLCTYFVPEERFKVPLVSISQPSEPKPLEPKPLPIVLQQPSNPKKMKRVFSSSISAQRPISTTSVDPQNSLGNANQYYFATHYHGVSAIVQIFNNGTFRGLNSRQVSLSDMRAFDMDYLLDGSIVFSGADILNSSEHPFLIGEPPIPLNQFLPGGVQVPPGIPFVVSNVQLPSGIPFTVSQAPNTFVTKWTTKGDILLGIAQTDSLKGTPVIVALDGTSPAHSNLSTGQLYYAGAAGTLSTEGKVLAGLALSPSLLHLRRE
jgi:hypothetical protein